LEISDKDEEALDRYEGVRSGSYRKVQLTVLHGEQQVDALVYIDPVTTEGRPKREYAGRINEALKDAKLSGDYVTSRIRPFISEV
jgi:hypothetical protein